MRKILVLITFCFALMFASQVFAADSKIGSVDIQKVLLQSDRGQQAKDQLSKKAASYDAEKNKREEELKNLKNDLEKQSALLSESAKSSKEKDYQQKLKEYQRFLKDAQDDLQAKNDELTNKLVEGIVKIVQDYGKKNGYTVIFVKNDGMVFVDDRADVTDAILQQFNASH
ncbi:MAG: OmpH family outer membrane protein [Desulfuromonadales bacterium]|nr:OmpH family outer membrane protein [Desulfuromonadales bacterium]